jgi:DDE domain
MIEQDHRDVKSRIAPLFGFKIVKRAAVTISGIQLLHRIRKGQFAFDRLGVQGQAAPAIGAKGGAGLYHSAARATPAP